MNRVRYFLRKTNGGVVLCGKQNKKVPKKTYTIKEAVTYLGWLGGPKRAPSDGPPGVKTVWTGLNTLNTLLTYREWLS